MTRQYVYVLDLIYLGKKDGTGPTEILEKDRFTMEVAPGCLVDMTALELRGGVITRGIVHAVIGLPSGFSALRFPPEWIRQDSV